MGFRWTAYYEAPDWKNQEQGYSAKKLEWQKPKLIYLEKVISGGNEVLCEDVCLKGNGARYYCSKGTGNK